MGACGMSWTDATLMALRNLWRRGTRTLLATLGVTLGTTLLVALLSVTAAADSRVVSQLSKGGPIAAIHVADSAPDPSNLDSDSLKTAGHRDLDETALSSIKRSPHVVSVVPVLSIGALVVPCPASDDSGGTMAAVTCRNRVDPYFATLVGSDLARSPELPVTLLAGRLPEPHSMTEVAVGQGYLDRLHLDSRRPGDVVGSEVEFAEPRVLPGNPPRYQGRWFRALVVGVVAQTVEDGDFLVPLEQTQAARGWALTGVDDGRRFRRPTSPYSAAVVVADNLQDIHTVRAEIAGIGYATSAPEHLVASVQKYLHVVDIVLGGIGAVALAISALGVANSLLAAVRERWREIGVLKALGAEDRDVLRWFLVEAGLLGMAGGLVGTLAGAGLAGAVGLLVDRYLREQGLRGLDLGGPPWSLLVAAPIVATLIALLGAALPALRAARLPAREAIGGI